MDTDMLQSIYAHASWANAKLFDTADEQGHTIVSFLNLRLHWRSIGIEEAM